METTLNELRDAASSLSEISERIEVTLSRVRGVLQDLERRQQSADPYEGDRRRQEGT